MAAARKELAALRMENRILRRANDLLRTTSPPKRRFEAIAVMSEEGLAVKTACRVLEVTTAWTSMAPLAAEARRGGFDLDRGVVLRLRGPKGHEEAKDQDRDDDGDRA